ncbi:hypothetical protein [Methylomonas koyamae]|uniref:hypothetical protein n=1 Tax=Methylomonas koyamae TaxID=702114 RepID=UPI001C7E20C2|nr:hypothetical protein [Methylomonas koyamae]
MKTKQTGNLSPTARDKSRQDKTKVYRQEIEDEWRETELGYMTNNPRNPARFYMLAKLAKAAGDDFRKNGHNYSEWARNFAFDWRPANAGSIKVQYYITRFGYIALKPPAWCVFTRAAMGLKQAKGHYQTNADFNKRIVDYLYSSETAKIDRFTVNDLLIRAVGLSELDIKIKQQTDVGRLMAFLGWDRRRETIPPRRHYYARPAKDRLSNT